MPASQFVALLPQPLGLAPRTSQRRAAFCNCGPAARAPDVGLVCLPRRELDGWILWVSQISKIFQNQHLRPSFLGLETKEAHSLTEHLPLSFGSPGWQKSRFPWSKAVKELRWHEIRFPHSWNSKNPMQLLHLGRWFLLQSKKTFCSVVLFPRVVYGGPIEALNHQSAITIFGPGTLSLKASLGWFWFLSVQTWTWPGAWVLSAMQKWNNMEPETKTRFRTLQQVRPVFGSDCMRGVCCMEFR